MNYRTILFIPLFFLMGFSWAAKAQPAHLLNPQKASPFVFTIAPLPHSFHETYTEIAPLGEQLLVVKGDRNIYLFNGYSWDTLSVEANSRLVSLNNGVLFIIGQKSIFRVMAHANGEVKSDCMVDTTFITMEGEITSFFPYSPNHFLFTLENGLWLYDSTITHLDATTQRNKLLQTSTGAIYLKEKEGVFSIDIANKTVVLDARVDNLDLNNTIAAATIDSETILFTKNWPFIHRTESTKNLAIESSFSSSFTRNSRIKKVLFKNELLFILSESDGLLCLNPQGEIAFQVQETHPSIVFDRPLDITTISGEEVILLTNTSLLYCSNNKQSGVFPHFTSLDNEYQELLEHDNRFFIVEENDIFASRVLPLPFESTSFEQIARFKEPVTAMESDGSSLYIVQGNKVMRLEHGKHFQTVKLPNHLTKISTVKLVKRDDAIWAFFCHNQQITGYCLTTPNLPMVSMPPPSHSFIPENTLIYNDYIFIEKTDGSWRYRKITEEQADWSVVPLNNSSFEKLIHIPGCNLPAVISDKNISLFHPEQGSKGTELFQQNSRLNIPLFKSDSLLIVKSQSPNFSNTYSVWLYQYSEAEKCFIPTVPYTSLLTNIIINSANLLADQTVVLSTNNGLLFFKKPLKQNTPYAGIHQLYLSKKEAKFFIKDGHVSPCSSQTLEVPSHLNRYPISVSFAGIPNGNWSFSKHYILFSSKLSGVDEDWLPWTKNNFREIGKLSPGKYSLSVRTKNCFSNISEPVTIHFAVLPSVYETILFYVLVSLLLLVAIYTIYRWIHFNYSQERFKLEILINKRTEDLAKEKEKAENLITRVLPRDTASELKEKGRVNSQRFKMVTVLFSDIEGFTRIVEEINPEVLIDQLDRFFLHFDSVVDKFRIEKIKTIGDAYMCAGGIPEKNRTNPVEVVLAALEMINFMKDINTQSSFYQNIWEFRIGIDTGPVIAGVVGRNKLSYDIWGSTVNIASRMQSTGESGQINISGNTYMLIEDYFSCTYRGSMPFKNRGDIEMYFVNGIKPDLSVNGLGIEPNHNLKVRIQLIRMGDLEDLIFEKMEKGLPKNLYYHDIKHTVDVYTQVELIGRAEGVSDEDMLLLRTAALFHDTGHLIDYDTHEEMAVKLAHQILPEYQYSDQQIDAISELIMSTKLPPEPKNLLEEIICDADLDYLGRIDFLPVSQNLYKELHEHGKIGTLREWNIMQIKFISNHSYFTKTARELRNVNKQSQLDKLNEWLDNN